MAGNYGKALDIITPGYSFRLSDYRIHSTGTPSLWQPVYADCDLPPFEPAAPPPGTQALDRARLRYGNGMRLFQIQKGPPRRRDYCRNLWSHFRHRQKIVSTYHWNQGSSAGASLGLHT